ncbi:MAG: site-2 protease family protein [Patescibacteria group bacterium]
MQEFDFIFAIAILIMSVVSHEVAHGLMALALGDETAHREGRLTLNPLRHIDPLGSVIVPAISYFAGGLIFGWAKPVPYNPHNLKNSRWGEALVALAGPMTNIFIAVFFGLLIRFGIVYNFLPETFIHISILLVTINLLLAVFNLVPIPPLDGSKILFSLFPYHLYGLRARIEESSLILLLIFVFFLWQFIYPVVTFLFGLITGLPIL